MDANTLYYTFSAIPQVIGAMTAVIGAFTHFRIATLKEYLIGDGKSVLNRWGEIGYKLSDADEDQRQMKRLRDSIDRRNIQKIKRVISLLSDNEKSQGYSKEKRPTGLQHVYERFRATESDISRLRDATSLALILSFTSILTSIISLATTDILISTEIIRMKHYVLWLNVTLFVASLYSTMHVIGLGLNRKTAHEAEAQS